MNQSFSYDVYGNNTKSGSPDSWIPPYNGGYDPLTNRYQAGGSCGSGGIAYDTDGNLLCDTFHAYTWDGEARLSSVDGKTLTRDAFGRVVESQTWGTTYEGIHTPMGDMWYSGQNFAWGNVKLPGGGSAKYNAGSLQAFNHPDWAGSSRLSTNTGRTLASSTEYAPFGEDYNHGTSVSNFDFAFNGGSKMDMFLGMYDTPARELHPVQGRWIQPDPAGLAAVDPSNPQTWNRYAYVGNNPLSATDPSGLLAISACNWDNTCSGGPPDDCDTWAFYSDCFFPYPGDPPPGWGGGGGPGGPGGPGGRGPGSSSGGDHGPWPGNETTGLPQLPTQPLSLGDLLGLTPGCDFGVCNPIGNGFGPGVVLAGAGAEGLCVLLEPCGLAEVLLSIAAAGIVYEAIHPENDCDVQESNDLARCRQVPIKNGARGRCYDSVSTRRFACDHGRPLPPLITW